MSKAATIDTRKRQGHYYHNNMVQAGVAIVTYQDDCGNAHMLMARDNPLWPTKEQKDSAQFVGGKIDEKDRAGHRLSKIPVSFIDEMNDHLSQKLKTGLPDKYQAHLEVLLEGTLRETEEETGIHLPDFLETHRGGYINCIHREIVDTPENGQREVYGFHIHLGKLSPLTEQALLEQTAPKDDLLMAGFVPEEAFRFHHKQHLPSYIEHFDRYAKMRTNWEFSKRITRTSLSDENKHNLEAALKQCARDPEIALAPYHIHAQLTPLTSAPEHDTGTICARVFEDIKAREAGSVVPYSVTEARQHIGRLQASICNVKSKLI